MSSDYRKIEKVDKLFKKFLPLLLIFLCYSPIVEALEMGKLYQLYSYSIYGLLAVFSLWHFWVHRGVLVHRYPHISYLYMLMVLYVIASCVKLCYVPSSIFYFQRLVCFCSFLSVGSVFLLMKDGIIKRTFRMWWRFVPWITFMSLVVVVRWRSLSMLFLVSFFMMLADCLRKQLRFLTYALVAYLAIFGIYQRMDYLLVAAPIFIYCMIRFKIFMDKQKCIMLYHILMWIPVFFLIVALTGKFNVLKFDSYIEGEYVSVSGENMTDDTRSFLYEEAIGSAIKHNYVIWGRTPGYGYDSKFVKDRKGSYEEVKGVFPQRYSEVFCVNIFTWCGVVGLVAWFIFFYWFGISTLKHAKNNYIRGLTIYVGLFWIIDWIGNHFAIIDHRFILLYIILSVCAQPQFQCMNDIEIRNYFKRMLR